MHSPVAASKSVVRLRESLATIVGPATSTCTTAVGQRRWCRAAPVDASHTSTAAAAAAAAQIAAAQEQCVGRERR